MSEGWKNGNVKSYTGTDNFKGDEIGEEQTGRV